MKAKILLLAVIAASMGVNHALHAEDGKINFIGNVTDTACVISTSSASQTVNLRSVSAKNFSAAGSTASATRFDIKLTDCPDSVTSANVHFDGPTHPANSTILALNSDQTATNVGVAIYEHDGVTQIPIDTASADVKLSPAATNTLEYVAKYYATEVPVTAGTANANASFTIAYN
ncbi:fimbrial protein [Serratia symbiotica]|uniref:fimbrial protein n=1 Tax=Serratia symbiotica TaxID=138074 RepID=UPI00346468B3